jgi:hypothetical protein
MMSANAAKEAADHHKLERLAESHWYPRRLRSFISGRVMRLKKLPMHVGIRETKWISRCAWRLGRDETGESLGSVRRMAEQPSYGAEPVRSWVK